MADFVRGKQIKNKSEAINEVLDKNLEIIASEFEKQGEKSDRADTLELNQEELMAPKTCDSLDDLLEFDAQVLASHFAEETDIESDNDLSESIEHQYSEEPNEESSLDINNGPIETDKTVKEIKQILNQAIDESSEYDFEQQDSDSDSALIKAQNEKISQLESELSAFKKILEAQLNVDKGLEESSKKLKTISIFALIIAIFALLVSLLGGTLNSGKQVEATESQSLVIDVKKDSAIPATLKIDDLQSQPIALETEINKPEKILILPEDDISDSSTENNTVIAATVDKVPIKGWVVNLNSYEQLWEADKKIDELKKKDITTEMIIVNVKGIRWYRIRVTGFKTQSEADSYAATIKGILNINHAWVSIM